MSAPRPGLLWIARATITFAALLELLGFITFVATGLWSEEALAVALPVLAAVTAVAGAIAFFGFRMHHSARPPMPILRPGRLWFARGLFMFAALVELFAIYLFMITGDEALSMFVVASLVTATAVVIGARMRRQATQAE